MPVLLARLPVMSSALMKLGPIRYRVVSAVVVSLVLVVSSGCSNAGDSVVVLGDSITALGYGSLEENLGGTYALSLSGNFGKTVEQVIPEAQRLAGERTYDQVIINLGSNDVLQELPVDESMAAMRQMVGLYPDARCIHLVDINEHMVIESTGESRTDQAVAFNEALEEYSGSDDRLSVISWNDVASQELNDDEPPWSTLTTDSIHPTAQGNEEIDQLYRTALRRCPPL